MSESVYYSTNKEVAMKEIWKDIEGYEGLYQVSTKGRVKSLDYSVQRWRVQQMETVHFKGRFLKSLILRNGYLGVQLHNFGKRKPRIYRIHQLVAKAFIPNPNNYPQVNHKDENITNNCVENLEWCTQEYNNAYGTGRIRGAITNRKRRGTLNRRVVQMTLDDKEIAVHESCTFAEKATGVSKGSIHRVCVGKGHHAGGFHWKFIYIDDG